MRIGLFGGTFDPIHLGHLRAATEIREAFGLDRIYFIPAAIPPHKENRAVAPADDRIEMIRLAVGEKAGFVVSELELNRQGISYTIDTVAYFLNQNKGMDEFFLIIGVDAFLEIDTWKSYRDLFKHIPLIIMARPDFEKSVPGFDWKSVDKFMYTNISNGYQFSESRQGYLHQKLHPVFRFNISMLDISGTKIRQLIKKGMSIRFLVPARVEQYIHERGLYI
jgi:nicotinate-nucleotide adenylyltransferase